MKHLYTLFFTLLWIAPSLIAFARGHKNLIPIIIVNFLLSFTLIGYIVSLIWCFSDNTHTRRTKLKDWQLFILFIIIATISATLFMIDLQSHTKEIINFVRVYTFEFPK